MGSLNSPIIFQKVPKKPFYQDSVRICDYINLKIKYGIMKDKKLCAIVKVFLH